MEDIAGQLIKLLIENGAADVGFARTDDGPGGLMYAVSVVVPLSGAIVDEIDGAPTHTYYSHYRAVNAYIDRLLLMAGLLLQRDGYRYMTVAASQTINKGEDRQHMGRYSHKKAACLAGLGTVGKSTLFLHPVFGPRVRLGTLFTDCPLAQDSCTPVSGCGNCSLCVEACPAHAIKGVEWRPGTERGEMLDPDACNNYMRAHFMKIGRGAVCGVCMKVCPRAKGAAGGRLPGFPQTSAPQKP